MANKKIIRNLGVVLTTLNVSAAEAGRKQVPPISRQAARVITLSTISDLRKDHGTIPARATWDLEGAREVADIILPIVTQELANQSMKEAGNEIG